MNFLLQSENQVVASYDHRGQHIYTGNSKGRVTILSVGDESKDQDMKVVSQFRVTQQVTSTTAIKSIEFARRSKSFLVNTADRVIRVYKTADVLKIKDGK